MKLTILGNRLYIDNLHGSVMPCSVTEARLMGMANFATETGKRITLEIEK